MATRIAQSPALIEFAEDLSDLELATKAIMTELGQSSRPAQDLVGQVAATHHLDQAVVQKALIAAVRRGDVVMDQRFTIRVV